LRNKITFGVFSYSSIKRRNKYAICVPVGTSVLDSLFDYTAI
jgi:hypothetical protein